MTSVQVSGGLVLLLIVVMYTVQPTSARREQGKRDSIVASTRLVPSLELIDDDTESQLFHQEINQVIQDAQASSSGRNKHRSGRKLLRAIERVVLRHSCVKMDSDEIIYILKQGRENEPKFKKQLHQLRKTLSRRAMLCRLKRVRWRPIKIKTEKGNRKQRAQGTNTFLQSILAQVDKGGTAASIQNLLGGKASGASSVNPLAALACRHDVPYRQLVPGRELLARLLTQIQQSGCWTSEAQSLYQVVEQLAESTSGHHARITARAWCALMRRFDQCRTQQKQST